MKQSPALRWLGWAAGAVSMLYIVLFVLLAVLRLNYPYEVEWNEGAVLDHAIRLLHGQHIYAKPSLDFAAFLYTPLYYIATACVMKAIGVSLFAGRLVSVLSTIISAILIGIIVHRETRSSLATMGALGIFAGFYSISGYFYDIVRMDAMMSMLVLASLFCIVRSQSVPKLLGSAVVLSLAFFTKQQALLFFPVVALWLWRRDRRAAIYYAGFAILFLLAGVLFFNWQNDGWFRYYVFTMPRAKANSFFSAYNAFEFLHHYLVGSLSISAIVILAGWSVQRRERSLKDASGLLLLAAIAAAISATLSFGNIGGYKNVVLPLCVMLAALVPIGMWRLSNRHGLLVLPVLLLMQFAALYYNPLGEKMLIASAHQRNAGDEFIAKLRTIPGEVWIPYHGYIATLAGKRTYIHSAAIVDVTEVGDSTARELARLVDSAYQNRIFSAIITEESKAIPSDSVRGYTLAGRMLSEPNVFLSRFGDEGTRPNWIFVPSPR